MSTPQVSVVVPALNAERSIAGCVASLLALDFAPERREIVVVDNGSTDRTRALLGQFGEAIRVLSEPVRGSAAARNRGIREARGALVAFTDADCTVGEQWLAALLPRLEDTAVGIAGGPILSRRPCNRVELFGESIHDHRAALERLDPPYAIAMNWASRREVLLAAGLFDETLLRGQDVDLAWRLHAAGYRLVYEERGRVYHRNERTPWGLAHEGYLHGLHGVRVRAKHGLAPRTRIAPRLAAHAARLLRGEGFPETALALVFDTGKWLGERVGAARQGP
jgi:glycosyltransferase involved in cell wall biosynthesis